MSDQISLLRLQQSPQPIPILRSQVSQHPYSGFSLLSLIPTAAHDSTPRGRLHCLLSPAGVGPSATITATGARTGPTTTITATGARIEPDDTLFSSHLPCDIEGTQRWRLGSAAASPARAFGGAETASPTQPPGGGAHPHRQGGLLLLHALVLCGSMLRRRSIRLWGEPLAPDSCVRKVGEMRRPTDMLLETAAHFLLALAVLTPAGAHFLLAFRSSRHSFSAGSPASHPPFGNVGANGRDRAWGNGDGVAYHCRETCSF